MFLRKLSRYVVQLPLQNLLLSQSRYGTSIEFKFKVSKRTLLREIKFNPIVCDFLEICRM